MSSTRSAVENLDEVKRNYITNAQKWWISIVSGLLFALLSSPFVYGVTNSIFGRTTNGAGPTFWGILLHTIVFTLIIRLLMF